MNNTGGPVDVWAVEGYDEAQLLDNGSGYQSCRHRSRWTG